MARPQLRRGWRNRLAALILAVPTAAATEYVSPSDRNLYIGVDAGGWRFSPASTHTYAGDAIEGSLGVQLRNYPMVRIEYRDLLRGSQGTDGAAETELKTMRSLLAGVSVIHWTSFHFDLAGGINQYEFAHGPDQGRESGITYGFEAGYRFRSGPPPLNRLLVTLSHLRHGETGTDDLNVTTIGVRMLFWRF